MDSIYPLRPNHRDARILENLTSIRRMLEQFEHRPTHSGAFAGTVCRTLEVLEKIHSKIDRLIAANLHPPNDLRDGRITERLNAIGILIGELQNHLVHARAYAGTARVALVALGEIQSRVHGLIGDEFYGLADPDKGDDSAPTN